VKGGDQTAYKPQPDMTQDALKYNSSNEEFSTVCRYSHSPERRYIL